MPTARVDGDYASGEHTSEPARGCPDTLLDLAADPEPVSGSSRALSTARPRGPGCGE